MWRSPSRPPAVVVHLARGSHPRHGAEGGTSYSQARPPGRRPLWLTQTHLLHPIAPQWSDWTEGALSYPNQINQSLPASICVSASQLTFYHHHPLPPFPPPKPTRYPADRRAGPQSLPRRRPPCPSCSRRRTCCW